MIVAVQCRQRSAAMKYFCLALLFASTAIVSHAQTTAPPTDTAVVEVLKFNWSKERIGWENDPFRGPIENFDEMRARTRNEKRITDAKGSGNADKVKRDASADAANIATQHKNTASRYVFTYKTTVKNSSAKTIKSIDWDYIFFDKGTETETGRQQFTSEEKIGPGKSKELVVSITKPPSHTISVTALNENERDSLIGRVVVVRIDYSDGTYWQRPGQ
jgi:hypothetical protein